MFYQCFTMLWQEPEIQALQVLNPDKMWVNAPPIPGTLVMKYARPVFHQTRARGSHIHTLALATNSPDGRVRYSRFS